MGTLADGRLDTVAFPNGTDTAYGYEPTNRIDSITHSRAAGSEIFARYDYDYDGDGNRTHEVAQLESATETTSFSYDNVARLRGFTRTAGSDTWETNYIFSGYNRATETEDRNGVTDKTRTYTYDDHLNRLLTVGEAGTAGSRTLSYDYDANGNTLRRSDSADAAATVEYDYDAQDRLTRAVGDPTGAATVQGRFDYDWRGMRTRSYGSSRGDIEYVHDGSSVLQEQRPDGTLVAHYRYADRLLSLDTGGDRQYYHHDALGSVGALTTIGGATSATYRTDPFGAGPPRDRLQRQPKHLRGPSAGPKHRPLLHGVALLRSRDGSLPHAGRLPGRRLQPAQPAPLHLRVGEPDAFHGSDRFRPRGGEHQRLALGWRGLGDRRRE